MAASKPKADAPADTRTQVERDRDEAQAVQARVDQAVYDATHDREGNPVPIGGGAPTHR